MSKAPQPKPANVVRPTPPPPPPPPPAYYSQGLTADEHKLRRWVCNKLNKSRDIDLLRKIAKLLQSTPT